MRSPSRNLLSRLRLPGKGGIVFLCADAIAPARTCDGRRQCGAWREKDVTALGQLQSIKQCPRLSP
jgi:hypothetical protein